MGESVLLSICSQVLLQPLGVPPMIALACIIQPGQGNATQGPGAADVSATSVTTP